MKIFMAIFFLVFLLFLFNVHSYCGYREIIVGVVTKLTGWEARGSNTGMGKKNFSQKRPCQF